MIENNKIIGRNDFDNEGITLNSTIGSITMMYNTIATCNIGINSNTTNSKVYYNLFNNNNIAIKVQKNAVIDVTNNTFAANSKYSIQSLEGSVVNSKNNIYYLSSSFAKVYDFGGSYNSDYNLFNIENPEFLDGNNSLTTWKSVTRQDINSKLGDPLFMNSDEGDFRLKDESLAINSGINANLYLDFYGTSVPQFGTPDIGFYESDTRLNESVDSTNSSKSDITFNISIYPNPTTGKLFIDIGNMKYQPALIRIIDETGKTIISTNNDGREVIMINLEKQSRGIYFAVISCNGQIISRKIIVL